MRAKRLLVVSAGIAAVAALLAPIGAMAASQTFTVTSNNGTESSGTHSSGGTGGCQFGGTCEVLIDGTATVTIDSTTPFPVSYHADIYIDYAAATAPSPGNFCAPVNQGTVTLTSTGNTNDTIDKSETGQLCGGDAAGSPHTFTGTYTITGGTGQYSGATGNGTSSTQDNGSGSVTSSNENGTFDIEPGTGVPESPASILLPMAGFAVVAGSVVAVRRNRRSERASS